MTCRLFCTLFFLLLQEDGVSCHHRDVSQMFLASGEWPWGEKLLRTVMLTWPGGITTQRCAEFLGGWIRMDDLWKMKMHLDDMRWYDRIHVLVSDFMLRWSNKHESVKRSISMPALDSQETSLSKHYINFLGIVPGDFLLSMMINSPSNHHFWNIFHFFPPILKQICGHNNKPFIWWDDSKEGANGQRDALKMDEFVPWKATISKGKSSSKHHFSGAMFVFGRSISSPSD